MTKETQKIEEAHSQRLMRLVSQEVFQSDPMLASF
jgi:hypothetical protein